MSCSAVLVIIACTPLPGRIRRLLPSSRADVALVRSGDFANHHRRIQAAIQNRATVVFLGDSLTSRWLTVGRKTWNHRIKPLGAECLGVGEDRVEHLLGRLETLEFRGLEPSVVVAMIGTNDIAFRPPNEVASGIGLCVKAMRRQWPQASVILMGITPRRDRGSWFYRADIRDINARLATIPGIRFIDIGHRMSDRDGYLRHEMTTDGLHLSAVAYQIWADAVGDVIIEAQGSPPRRSQE